MRIFTPATDAIFIERPNRFLARVRLDGRVQEVHCPDPGSLRELLLPGTRVILEESRGWSEASAAAAATVAARNRRGKGRRKTRYTMIAVHYRERMAPHRDRMAPHSERVVPLVSTRANKIAEGLVIPRLFPDALRLEREVTWGNSRFDFRIVTSDGPVLLEVKCCTLVEEGVAMFPDAPTARGRRHVEELGKLSSSNQKGAVLFLVMQPQARVFMPNIHTDPAFSETLIRMAPRLRVYASSVFTNREGEVILREASLPVDLEKPRSHLTGGGSYLLVMDLRKSVSVTAGSLAQSIFRSGYYVYAGSAMRNLESRINRHKRQRKKVHWHIDYLTPQASSITALPFRSTRRLECALARQLAALSDHSYRGFGCSDCRCDSHLFFFERPPLENRAFLDLMNHFRHREAFEIVSASTP